MNVPEGWSQHRFEEITDLANGQVDPKVEPYLSMRHIGPENIASDTGQILGTDICKNLGLISGKYEFDENSLVYSKIRPNLNKLCRPNFKGVCSADMYPIWAKNPKELSIDFLAYYILYVEPTFCKLCCGSFHEDGNAKSK
ncbi:MAG: hypothetical protein KF908_12825 [Nitrosomonas sp.]|nr:hypothetical protein [Nitrosomonas sp.]